VIGFLRLARSVISTKIFLSSSVDDWYAVFRPRSLTAMIRFSAWSMNSFGFSSSSIPSSATSRAVITRFRTIAARRTISAWCVMLWLVA
jgi:hypothetical protein